jgi:hypothetical protein
MRFDKKFVFDIAGGTTIDFSQNFPELISANNLTNLTLKLLLSAPGKNMW